MRHVKILHIYSPISHSLFTNILFNTMVWPLAKSPNYRPSRPGLATNQHLKILDPSLGENLHKTWYGFYQYPKYWSHSKETSQKALHDFSKHRNRPTNITTDPKVYEHSPDNISLIPGFFRSSEVKDTEKNKTTIKFLRFSMSLFELHIN